jgi:hypothetical protein
MKDRIRAVDERSDHGWIANVGAMKFDLAADLVQVTLVSREKVIDNRDCAVRNQPSHQS